MLFNYLTLAIPIFRMNDAIFFLLVENSIERKKYRMDPELN